MAAVNFFVKSPDPQIQACINSRVFTQRTSAIQIKVNDTEYFNYKNEAIKYNDPTSIPGRLLLESVTITESGDYMTARKCTLVISCANIDIYEYIEKDFGFIDSNKKLYIRIYYPDKINEAEDTGWMEFRIVEPSFSITDGNKIQLTVKAIGAGSSLLSSNLNDVAFMDFPDKQFVTDYNWFNDKKPVETISDFFEWTIQSQTNQLDTMNYNPEHGANGKIEENFTENARWLTLHLSFNYYSADWQSVKTRSTVFSVSTIEPTIRYVSLSGLVQTINKYFTGTASAIQLRCDGTITNGNVAYNTKDGSQYYIFSANPKLILFPYAGDAKKSDYTGVGEAAASLTQGEAQSFELSKHTIMAPLLQSCDMTNGDLSGILISLDLIRKLVSDSLEAKKNDVNNKKDVSKLTIDTFFRSIFDTVKELSGGAFDLKLLVNNDLTTIQTTVFDVVNQRDVPEDTIRPVVFGLRDNNTLATSIQSKITQDLITAAYSGAPGTKGDTDAPSAIVSLNETKIEEEPTGLPSSQEIIDVKSKRLASTGFADDGVQAGIGVLKRLVSEQKIVDKVEQTTSLYPLEFSVTIKGIAGFKFGDCITSTLLPSRYKRETAGSRVIFTVHEVEHTKSKGKSWETTIKAMMRLISSNKITDGSAPTGGGELFPNTIYDDDENATGGTGGSGTGGTKNKSEVKSSSKTKSSSGTTSNLDDL